METNSPSVDEKFSVYYGIRMSNSVLTTSERYCKSDNSVHNMILYLLKAIFEHETPTNCYTNILRLNPS